MNQSSAAHPSHLAHHFDHPVQQFDSARFGMWLFLATEVLLFGGLFCAYAVFRRLNPEVFFYGHRYLDTTLGGINTAVLITSSLTMASAVRSAQLGRRRSLIVLLSLTILGGCVFLGFKYVEYEHKWKEGLLPGKRFRTHTQTAEADTAPNGMKSTTRSSSSPAPGDIKPTNSTLDSTSESPPGAAAEELSSLPPPGRPPAGLARTDQSSAIHPDIQAPPEKLHLFFGVYFLMTGLHGIHVLAGIFVIAWILIRAIKGQFGSGYFTPVDMVGLYWHLVDLIWIFLFPLLYLIH